jgi:hypothetical protein
VTRSGQVTIDKMKILLTILLATFGLNSFGQFVISGGHKKHLRLLTSSSQILYKDTNTIWVESIHYIKKSDSVLVTTIGGQKIKYVDKQVWGVYDEWTKFIYRTYNRKTLRVFEEPFILYLDQSSGTKGGHSTALYFSNSISGDLYDFNKENLDKIYADKKCFLEKLNAEFKNYKDKELLPDQKVRSLYISCDK